jgi:dTMP kinase
VFISIEGIDGSGKTTQAGLLAEALGPETVLVREPGGTTASERVRELLASPDVALEPLTELLLFCAARAQLTEEVIRPALDRGVHVVCDRFSDSSSAYQGIGRGLGIARVEQLSGAATDNLWPDLTLLLQIDPEAAAERMGGDDRFERAGLRFQREVAAGYEQVARRHPVRVKVVDASGSVEQVHAAVMAAFGKAGR